MAAKHTTRTLSAYFEQLTTEQRDALATRVGIVPQYLYQVATGRREASLDLTRRLAAETGLPASGIRRDYWQRMSDVTGVPAEQLQGAVGG